MSDYLKKFRDRLRITVILYTFSDDIENITNNRVAEFRTEVKIQAIDFLLRYPDFLSMELIDLLESDPKKEEAEIKMTIKEIFKNREPEIRVEEMEKFFHGAYESIDDIVAFLISIDFIEYESKKRRDGKEYEKIYYLTKYGKEKIDNNLKNIPSVKWHFERCALIKEHLGQFSGTELKKRQYKYQEEYAEIPYKNKIKQLHEKVKTAFSKQFKEELI